MDTRTDTETLYMISQHTLDPISRMPISKDEFNDIKKQKEILSAVQELQIRYEMILNNYMTLEKEFYSMVLENDLKIWDYDDYLDHRIRVNTLFLNLLTTVTSYCGYVKRVAKPELFNIETRTEEIFSAEEYKFLTGIRNYLQHGGILHSSIHYMSRIGTNEEGNPLIALSRILLNLDLYVDRNNKNLKIPSIFKDKLEDGQLSLHYVSRFCMDIHNSIHYEIIDHIEDTTQKARAYIENIYKDWEEHVKEKIPDSNVEYIKTRLCAYAFTIKDGYIPIARKVAMAQTTGHDLYLSLKPHSDLNISEKIPLSLVWDHARKTLSEKSLKNLHLFKTKYEL